MKLTKNTGMLVLGVWLILNGLMQIISMPIPAIIMAVLAIAAGVLVMFGGK